MGKIIATIGIMLPLAVPAWANVEKAGLLVKTTFDFSSSSRNVHSEKKMIIADENGTWTTLTDQKDGLIVLGRKLESKSGTIKMEYIVVDVNKSPNGVLSTPGIISQLGKSATIEVAGSSEKVAITLHADRINYRTETPND